MTPIEYPLGPALDFLRRLWRLEHALAQLSGRMERRLGVTAPQRLVVRCVGKYPGLTAGQLARVLCLDRGTVSASLRRLEQRGLLVRRRDPRDRRRIALGLTAAGRALDRPRAGTVEHAVEALLASSEPGAIERFGALIDRLATQVEAEDADGVGRPAGATRALIQPRPARGPAPRAVTAGARP